MRCIQVPTICNDFVDMCKNISQNNLTHVCYWCNPKVITLENKPNRNLIGSNIEVTDSSSIPPKSLVRGKIEDVDVITVAQLFNRYHKYIGEKSSNSINDFLYFINETLAGNYNQTSEIGYIYIKLKNNSTCQKVQRGNQLGVKNQNLK